MNKSSDELNEPLVNLVGATWIRISDVRSIIAFAEGIRTTPHVVLRTLHDEISWKYDSMEKARKFADDLTNRYNTLVTGSSDLELDEEFENMADALESFPLPDSKLSSQENYDRVLKWLYPNGLESNIAGLIINLKNRLKTDSSPKETGDE
jgi:hypothetical protein